MFWIHLIAVPNGGGNILPRNFTDKDLNNVKIVGNATSIHQFRIQAWNNKNSKINCVDPSFKGEITYFPYIDPPNCHKAEIISTVGTIVAAVIGAGGGIAVTLITQCYQLRQHKNFYSFSLKRNFYKKKFKITAVFIFH
jgi:hypothetical protein